MKKEQNIWIPFAGFIFLVISVVFFWIALPNLSARTPAPTPNYSETIHKAEVVENGFDFKTPALYFFSAVAQTMGALLAITFTVLFTQLNSIANSKKDIQRPIVPAPPEPLGYKTGEMFNPKEMEYERRKKEHEENKKIHYEHYIDQLINERLPIKPIIACLVKDSYLQDSLKFGLVGILASVISVLVMLVFKDKSSFVLLALVLTFASVIISLSTLSILKMITFLSKRYYLFSNKYKLVKENTDYKGVHGYGLRTVNKRITTEISKIILFNSQAFSKAVFEDLDHNIIDNVVNTFSEEQWGKNLNKLSDIALDVDDEIAFADRKEVYKLVSVSLLKSCCNSGEMNSITKNQQNHLYLLLSKMLNNYFFKIPNPFLKANIATETLAQIEENFMFTVIFYGYTLLESELLRNQLYQNSKKFYHNITDRVMSYDGISRYYLAKGVYGSLIGDITNAISQGGTSVIPRKNVHDKLFFGCLKQLKILISKKETKMKLFKYVQEKYRTSKRDANALYATKNIFGMKIDENLEKEVGAKGSRRRNELDQYIEIIKSGLE